MHLNLSGVDTNAVHCPVPNADLSDNPVRELAHFPVPEAAVKDEPEFELFDEARALYSRLRSRRPVRRSSSII